MSIVLEVSAAANQVVPPADYIKFLTEELARHRLFLNEEANKLGAFLLTVLAFIGGAATFMGWKSLKDIRESTREMFEGEAKAIFDRNVAELNDKIQAIGREHDASKKNISDLEQLYKERLAAIQEWLVKIQTDASVSVVGEIKARKLGILWVDGAPKLNSTFLESLRTTGVRIDIAESIPSAIDALSKNRYDILISAMNSYDEADVAFQSIDNLLPKTDVPDKIFYANASGIVRFGERAKAAGATLVTSNPGKLLELILQKSEQKA